MKILIFAPFLPPDPTGSSRFASDQILELLDRGHEVLVVTGSSERLGKSFEDTIPIKFQKKCQVVRLQSVRKSFGRASWNYEIPFSTFGFLRIKVLKCLRRFDPDVAIIHSILFDLNILALAWCRFHAVGTIVVSHTPLWHQDRLMSWVLEIYGRLILRPLVRSSKVFAVCVDKRTLENARHLFVSANRSSVIPISVDSRNVIGGDQGFARQHIPSSSFPIVLSLGHVVPIRNRINLVRALPSVVERFPDVAVVIVGMVKDGSFLRLADELGVRRHIHVVGQVDHEFIRHYLAIANVETHDLDGLGLGITSVEAMCGGLPVVAWVPRDNYPGIDLASYGTLGFVETGDPKEISSMIIRCVLDQTFVNEVRSSQDRLVREVFSPAAVTEKYLELLERLITKD